MYQPHYINPLRQFGKLNLDLILEDDEGVLPPRRISKSFDEKITDEDLARCGRLEIYNVLRELHPVREGDRQRDTEESETQDRTASLDTSVSIDKSSRDGGRVVIEPE